MNVSDRGMIFCGAMVCALLNGSKSMTRRVVKVTDIRRGARTLRWDNQNASELMGITGKYQAADTIWVRETWGHEAGGNSCADHKCGNPEHVWYKATEKDPSIFHKGFWRTPIFMPRWASRITRTIESKRIERVQDISEEDSIREGFQCREHFIRLWDAIAKPGFRFHDNPWVYVLGFERQAQCVAKVRGT